MAIGTSCQSHGSAPPPFLKVSSLLTEGSRWSFGGVGDFPVRMPCPCVLLLQKCVEKRS